MLSDPRVAPVDGAIRHLTGECQLYKGFVRFSDYGGVLVSVIRPKNRVLPLLQEHFCDRFNCERFVIFDQTHAQALVYRDAWAKYTTRRTLRFAADPASLLPRAWRNFINNCHRQRSNSRLQALPLPKRFWDP
jgi:probable DNA metabolism protein